METCNVGINVCVYVWYVGGWNTLPLGELNQRICSTSRKWEWRLIWTVCHTLVLRHKGQDVFRLTYLWMYVWTPRSTFRASVTYLASWFWYMLMMDLENIRGLTVNCLYMKITLLISTSRQIKACSGVCWSIHILRNVSQRRKTFHKRRSALALIKFYFVFIL